MKTRQKKAINNKFIYEAMNDFLRHQFEIYFLENPDEAARIAEQVLVNKRSRENAEKTRLNLKKKLAGTIDMSNRVQKFVDCRTKDVSRREIYIVEGDSALGSCKMGRDSESQSIIPVRGKILNCLKADYDKIFKSEIIVDIRPLAKIKKRDRIRCMKYEKIAEYSNTKFRRITGVKRATFSKMVEILQKAYAEKHRRRGRTPKLSIEDMLLATLEYLREYRTYAHIAASYGIAESNIYRGIKWVEDTLIRDGTFSLPGRKAPLKSDVEYEVILVDATQTPIERPKKKQKRYYSGKKKRHTLKAQLLVSLLTGEIIALAFSNGKKHDFQLFKDSRIHVKAETLLEADTGYQGLVQIHANSLLPKKRSKNHPLSKQERKDNREISKNRIFVEHAIRFVKRFRILSECYRNRRNRFALRFSLIAGICNFDRFA